MKKQTRQVGNISIRGGNIFLGLKLFADLTKDGSNFAAVVIGKKEIKVTPLSLDPGTNRVVRLRGTSPNNWTPKLSCGGTNCPEDGVYSAEIQDDGTLVVTVA
jgi:hypothetical protein